MGAGLRPGLDGRGGRHHMGRRPNPSLAPCDFIRLVGGGEGEEEGGAVG